MLIIAAMYTALILSLIWARFFFFVVRSNKSKSASRIYDLLVATQIFATYYNLVTQAPRNITIESLALLSYFIAMSLFFWSIKTAKTLEFAFSDSVGRLITNGPFKLVRHPFYTSYIVIWATSTILFFDSIYLWTSLLGLVIFYYKSAKSEECLILESEQAKNYITMRQKVGMFFPRATQWQSWILEKSAKNQN